ncbi:hypothetical protein, partial [Pseudomonas aeruginosa]|uniref:hypothetical protein n=1 Tax=Pseudomonas aeruginosa TaxID=287 RepID=UPI0021F0BABF
VLFMVSPVLSDSVAHEPVTQNFGHPPSTWREAEQQCRDGEIVNGELIGVYDCDPVTEAVCTARNDVMIENLGVCCG